MFLSVHKYQHKPTQQQENEQEETTSGESKAILEERFKELDFGHEGHVKFPAFLYGFAAWVMGDVSAMCCLLR